MMFLLGCVLAPAVHATVSLTARFRLSCFILPLRTETLRTLFHSSILAHPLHHFFPLPADNPDTA